MSICRQGYAHWHLTWLVLRKWLGTIKSYCHSSTEIFNLLTRDKQLKLTESLCDNEYIHIPLVNFLLIWRCITCRYGRERIPRSLLPILAFQVFSSIRSLSRVQLFATPWTTAHQASLSITNSRSPPKPMFIESVMPSSHLVLCHPLLFLPSIFPSIRVFSNESACRIRWPKYWSFSFNISPPNEHPGLISFRMDWLDLLAVQGTLKSLPQHHSSKASILLHSTFFIVQLSHPYMTSGETIALTRWTFVDKVMSLLFNMLSRLVITSLPRSKHLLISWLQSPSAVILEPKKIKSATVSTVSPSICQEVMGPDAMILVFWMLSFKPTLGKY